MSHKGTKWTDEQKKNWSEKCERTRINNINKRIGINVENRKVNQKNLAKKHYENNKEKMKKRAIERNAIAKARNRKFVDEYLIDHPCIDCNEKDIIVLEFDHIIGNKIANISDAIKDCWSIEKIKTEINKCVVRCANCHRRITHHRRQKKLTSKGESYKIGSHFN